MPYELNCEGMSSLLLENVERYYEDYDKSLMDEIWKLRGSSVEKLFIDDAETDLQVKKLIIKLLVRSSMDSLKFALELT